MQSELRLYEMIKACGKWWAQFRCCVCKRKFWQCKCKKETETQTMICVPNQVTEVTEEQLAQIDAEADLEFAEASEPPTIPPIG
jgi:hypothetical protein